MDLHDGYYYCNSVEFCLWLTWFFFAMEGMLRPTCTCPGIIPDLELIPVKLGKVFLGFTMTKMCSSEERVM